MTTTYTKSLSGDFGGNLNTSQLFNEIENAEIGPSCVTVKNESDDVELIFTSSLTSGEQTILDNLVSNHVVDTSKPHDNFFTITPKNEKIKEKSYRKIGTFKYDGSNQIGLIDYIEVISYKDSKIDSYDIRVIDRNNDVILASANFTNDISEICDLGTISNIPTEKTILEIHGRQNGGKKKSYLYIENITVYYNN